MSGDVPYKGTDPDDYKTFREETKSWQDENLRVYPALGNHELSGGVEKGVAEWWKAFPELKGMRWYSVALGDRISLIELDSADQEYMAEVEVGPLLVRAKRRNSTMPASTTPWILGL